MVGVVVGVVFVRVVVGVGAVFCVADLGVLFFYVVDYVIILDYVVVIVFCGVVLDFVVCVVCLVGVGFGVVELIGVIVVVGCVVGGWWFCVFLFNNVCWDIGVYWDIGIGWDIVGFCWIVFEENREGEDGEVDCFDGLGCIYNFFRLGVGFSFCCFVFGDCGSYVDLG